MTKPVQIENGGVKRAANEDLAYSLLHVDLLDRF